MDITMILILQQLDRNLLLWIQENLRADFLTLFWKGITFLGNGGWFWIALGVVLLFFKKTRNAGIASLLSMALCFLITNVMLKNIVARPRPFDTYAEIIPLITRPRDYSFPSGHTCASFASACICFRMLSRKMGVPALILAAMIAFSRLYLGVHYPTDVLGGFLIALLGSTVMYHAVLRAADFREQRRKTPAHTWKEKW